MKFYPLLYISPALENKREKIIWKLKCNIGLRGIYLLTLASNGRDLFDIMDASYVKQKALRRNLPMIIGITSSHSEALQTAIEIIEQTIQETGTADVKQYLKNQLKKEGK